MDRFFKEFQICKKQSIPYNLSIIEDSFAKELIKLWQDREMEGDVYVASLKGIPKGFLLVQKKDIVTIRGFWVDEVCRGQGIGTFLLKTLIEDTDSDIWVNITEGAEKIYRKFGFTLLGRREDYPDQIKAVRIRK